MKNTFQEVGSQIADSIKGFNKELKFKYDKNSVSFNVLDGSGTGEGYKYIYHQNKEDETAPLDHKQLDKTFNTAVSAASFDNDTYAFLSSNPLDIPIAHSLGCNYLIPYSDAVVSDYEKELSSIDVCLTTKSEAEIKTLRKVFDFNMDIIILDFKEVCPEYTKKDSLFTLAEKIQEIGKDGIDTINKYMHATYKKNTSEGEAIGKTPEDSMTHGSTKTTNNKSSVGLKNNATEPDFSAPQENIKSLPIDKLINDKKYQSRVSENKSAIEELAAAYKAGEDIAPLEVVDTGNGTYIITDGHHRYAGAKSAEMDHMKCHITKGTKLDAFKLSLGANESNKALKRTRADKRNAVETALDSKEFCSNTNRQIAIICKVSSTFVDNIVKKRKESGDAVQESANVCTHVTDDTIKEGANVCTQEENYIATDAEKIISAHHTDAVINIPQSITSRKTKAITEKVTNEHISLSVTYKSKPLSGEIMQGLMTDLKSVIDDYISDFKEAI